MPGAGTDKTREWPAFGGPAIILVEPQMGENIGAAARAMGNFGLTDLRLVRPRDGWPNLQAVRSASGADRVIEGARVYDKTEDAIADCTLLLATTAREHGQQKTVIDAEEAARRLQPRIAAGETTGILFGRERTGLENYEISLADLVVTLPVNPAFSSLNLAQAVLLMSYEWMKTGMGSLEETAFGALPQRPAKKDELQGLFDHMEEALDARGYFRPAAKKPKLIENLRSALTRPSFTGSEIQVLRGIVSCLDRFTREAPRGAGAPTVNRTRNRRPKVPRDDG